MLGQVIDKCVTERKKREQGLSGVLFWREAPRGRIVALIKETISGIWQFCVNTAKTEKDIIWLNFWS